MKELGTAITFTWLGMVLAISFLEAPLKFQAPNVTVQIGLGIGRLVFRALNFAESIFAACLLVAMIVDAPSGRVMVSITVAIAALLIQVAAVRPRLTHRTNRVLAGEVVPRSSGHLWYVLLEVAKVAALITSGVFLLEL
ncbi:MAG: hypothetical protein ABIN55_11865 [Aeromicrobium sp.]